MNINWSAVVVLLVTVGCSWGRPKDVEVQTPETSALNATAATSESTPPRLNTEPNNEEKLSEKKGLENYATVFRSSNDDPSLSPSVQEVADQLIETVNKLVDTRTPPVLQEKLVKDKSEIKNVTTGSTTVAEPVKSEPVVDKVEANGRFELKETNLSEDTSVGKAASSKKDEAVKGVAVPVIMDEEPDIPPKKLQKIPNVAKPTKEEKKKLPVSTKPQKEAPTTTPSSGLSTWILLSDNRDSTTPSTPKNKKVSTTTTKKPNKTPTTTFRTVTNKSSNKKPTPKPSESKKTDTTSALEGMVKNQKKTTTTRPVLKSKADLEKKDDDRKKVVTIPPAIIIDTTQVAAVDDGATDSTVETTTKKKKTSNKKRKKNKNRKKKPAEKTGGEQEIKDLMKQPKQPVGAQFYNFLSREIMPTVGLGLVGVLVTAGLAGLLGYNPFNNNLPVRRTYESQHGYSPNPSYYAYNSEYGESDGGQNEEVLFREVLSGMPEESRYNLPHSDASYPEAQLYSSQEQAYGTKNTGQPPSASSSSKPVQRSPEKKTSSSQSSQTDYSSAVYGSSYNPYEEKDSYVPYSGGNSDTSSFVYPEKTPTTEKFKASAKYNEEGTIEKQPEALYRVSGDYSSEDGSMGAVPDAETSWHRIGSPSMDYSQYSNVEPGPRRLNIDKMTAALTGVSGEKHKRSKRSPEGFFTRLVRRSKEIADLQNDQENEIDSDDIGKKEGTSENYFGEITTLEPIAESSPDDMKTVSPSTETSTEESKVPNSSENTTNDSSTASPSEDKPPTFMDVIRRLAQFKLRLGINFLKTTADTFSKYLEGVQRKVEDHMVNDTTFPSLRNTFLGRDVNYNEQVPIRVREKRFQRDAFRGKSE